MTKYVTIKVADFIDEVVENFPKMGFRNRSEFIMYAIRESIHKFSPEMIFPPSLLKKQAK